MITDLVFRFFEVIVKAVDLLLPDWVPFDLDPLLTSFESNGSTLFGLFIWVDYYVPLSELLVVVGLGLTLFVASVIYRGAMQLGRTLHLFGGGR